MILTGTEIARQIELGNITFSPFLADQINPNSCNYRLGPHLKVFKHTDEDNNHVFRSVRLPEQGYVLRPGTLYLGHTYEVIGSTRFAMSLIGRSSIGRLGLFLQISANLGHTTSCHQWTLELYCVKPIRVYPQMRIGQVSFWSNAGEVLQYRGKYTRHNMPTESRFSMPSDAPEMPIAMGGAGQP